MLWEQLAADNTRLTWDTRCYGVETPTSVVGVEPAQTLRNAGSGIMAQARAWSNWRRRYYEWLVKTAAFYDLVLVRHSLHDPYRANALSQVATKVATVHHTLEVPELGTIEGGGGLLRKGVERYCGPRSIAKADVVVGMTAEIAHYEVARIGSPRPTVVYPNGAVVTDEDREAAASYSRSALPSLLFVASRFAPWHGLDRLLASLDDCVEDFELIIVGRTSAADRAIAQGDSRIRFLGVLEAAAIAALARRSWVGLSSFALDRNGMQQACPLKVREYLKTGLPVYGGHEETFPYDVPFYRSGPADLNSILDFAHQIQYMTPAGTLDAAIPYIDKARLLKACLADLTAAIG